jgi:hypothetical protein
LVLLQEDVLAESHKDVAIDFLGLVASGKVREAYEKHVGAGFRHHNPYFRGDAASLMDRHAAECGEEPAQAIGDSERNPGGGSRRRFLACATKPTRERRSGRPHFPL